MNPRKEVAQKNWGSGLWTAPSPPQAGGPEPPAPGPRRPRCRRRGFPWVPPCRLPKHARPAVHPASTDRAPRRAVTVRIGACVSRPWPQGRDADAAVNCTVTSTAQPRPAPSGLRPGCFLPLGRIRSTRAKPAPALLPPPPEPRGASLAAVPVPRSPLARPPVSLPAALPAGGLASLLLERRCLGGDGSQGARSAPRDAPDGDSRTAGSRAARRRTRACGRPCGVPARAVG